MHHTLKSLILILVFGAIFILTKDLKNQDIQAPNLIVVDKPNSVKSKNADTKEIPSIKINPKIPEIIEWEGIDPYPNADWSGAVPELKIAVDAFEHEWGKPLKINQVYRPEIYGKHMRSVWEVWRYLNGQSYTVGYGCDNAQHINPDNIGDLNQDQIDYLNSEVDMHGFLGGDTPPACVSDHAKGIAIDITSPFDAVEYERFINVANSVGLCHYIAGDEPHFGLTSRLPAGTDCFVK